MKTVSLVITDLDNTLFDWLAIWHATFSALFNEVQRISQVEHEQLKREFRACFQNHGTSEYAFALQELPCLMDKYSKDQIREVFAPAIDAFRKARREVLQPYPKALDVLRTLKAEGCLIVGYTESMQFYTNYRLRKLGFDLLLDYLYSPADHELPADQSRDQIRKYPEEHYELRRTIHRFTPDGELKPNPKLLLDIISGVNGTVAKTIYVGDSLMKDITMAQDAGVTDVWAKYGAGTQRPEYELLRAVSHWPESTVQKEKGIIVRPTCVLETGLDELLSMFKFVAFDKSVPSHVVEMWKTTVAVQQHFNDLQLRIRNYAVTLLVAVLGASAVALKENMPINVIGINMTLSAVLVGAGLVGWLAFWFMDGGWYHRFLLGAVNHGQAIETHHECPEIRLTKAIGDASPIRVCCFEIKAEHRLHLFYGIVAVALLVLMWTLSNLPTTSKQPVQDNGKTNALPVRVIMQTNVTNR